MLYQTALRQLQLIQVLDAELAKARPSSQMTSASPAWKAARVDFLARISPVLTSLFARERIRAAYRKGFASSFTPEEADALMSFLASREGRIYFLARRLVGRQKALESYIFLTATNRSNLPELVPAQTVQSDMNQLSRESTGIGKPDQETIDRVRAIGEGVAWKKLQRMTTAGVFDSLKELAANGQLDGSQGLVQQVVKKAVDDFQSQNQ
jgi:hypothetical protein